MKRYGFIFARGGSKGVVGKNIKLLSGIPLIGYAIKAGLDSGKLDRIIVSTDSPEIAKVSQDFGAEVPFLRPRNLAQDDSPEWLAWRHAVDQVDDFDQFVSLPCTAPLRIAQDINNCIDVFESGGCDIVVTARAAERHPSFNMVTLDASNRASIVMPPDKTISRRQDAPPVFDLTTVCYVTSPEYIRSREGVFEGVVKAAIVPSERAVDIDTELDFAFAEFLMSQQHCSKC